MEAIGTQFPLNLWSFGKSNIARLVLCLENGLMHLVELTHLWLENTCLENRMHRLCSHPHTLETPYESVYTSEANPHNDCKRFKKK